MTLPLGTIDPTAPGAIDLGTARRRLVRWHLGFDRYIGWILPLLFVVAILPILDMVYWISARALPTFTWATISYSRDGSGLYGPIVGTIYIMLVATAVAVALGLFGGIATSEFLSERAASWVRLSANTLAGVPAIVIGFFGYFFFVEYFGWGLSIVAGGVTTAIFMTPYIFRSADLAFSAVPRHLREAAYGSGSRPIDYILRVARPIVLPQVLNGIFIAIALGVGETATVILTVSYSQYSPTMLSSPAGFLTGTIWFYYNSVISSQQTLAFQAAFILLVGVIALNVVVRIISWRSEKKLVGLFT